LYWGPEADTEKEGGGEAASTDSGVVLHALQGILEVSMGAEGGGGGV
jgi:hypothetical protein